MTVDARSGVALQRIEQVVDETLARLLARVRSALFAHMVRALQSPSAQADWLARSKVYGAAGRASDEGLSQGTAALTFDLLDAGMARDSGADLTGKLETLGATFGTDIVRRPAFPPASSRRCCSGPDTRTRTSGSGFPTRSGRYSARISSPT